MRNTCIFIKSKKIRPKNPRFLISPKGSKTPYISFPKLPIRRGQTFNTQYRKRTLMFSLRGTAITSTFPPIKLEPTRVLESMNKIASAGLRAFGYGLLFAVRVWPFHFLTWNLQTVQGTCSIVWQHLSNLSLILFPFLSRRLRPEGSGFIFVESHR